MGGSPAVYRKQRDDKKVGAGLKKKIKIYQRMVDEKLIAIVRTKNYNEAKRAIDAIIEGGITIIEITLTTPEALRLIRETKEMYNGSALVGAGTVLTPQQAALAINAGAEFIVSPHFDSEIVKVCHLEQVMVIPGATVFKDMVQALAVDCSVIKLFPANTLGPEAIKSFNGPLPQVDFIPTGGVNLDTIQEWLKAGAAAVGIGGDLTKKALQTNDFSYVTTYAKELVTQVNAFKKAVKA
jgi:2-dehydro-3-deoxyphosphogluconate aldolase/(4S)-4-hydroxy-2-oxoglutarate aldolase